MNIKNIFFILIPVTYGLCPFDLVPDFLIPFFGWLDDILITVFFTYALYTGKIPPFILNFFQKRFISKEKYQKEQDFSHYFKNNAKSNSKNNSNSSSESKLDEDPYEILGVLKNSSQEEIKKAYYKKIHMYHPDKLSHLGDEFKILAQEKFIKIQNAYKKLNEKKNTIS